MKMRFPARTLTSLPVLVLVFVPALAAAQIKAPVEEAAERGHLLYETHCIGCHGSVAHVRERRARSHAEIAQQVARWQANQGLNWSAQDIDVVERYLDRRFYKLQQTHSKNGSAKRSD